jgi:transposase
MSHNLRILTRVAGRDRDATRGSDIAVDFLTATAGLSSEAVGEMVGVSAATIARWRRSGVKNLRVEFRQKMLSYLAGLG